MARWNSRPFQKCFFFQFTKAPQQSFVSKDDRRCAFTLEKRTGSKFASHLPCKFLSPSLARSKAVWGRSTAAADRAGMGGGRKMNKTSAN